LRILIVAQREIKLGFRNAWTYSFLILLTFFTAVILLLQTSSATSDGYTDMTGTIMNMTLYLLPLITLLLGGFSTAAEKEDGQWGLLSTYPISAYIFLNAWTYSFLILLTFFTAVILLLQTSSATSDGYTDMTGTIMNMTLYLLPLITLLLGGFSTAAEKEDGQWGLLSTYPISAYIF